MEIWGQDTYENYRYVDIILVPCNYVHTAYGYTEDKVTDECLSNKTLAEDYLRNIRAYVYMSEKRFERKGYDQETIIKRSRFYAQQMNSYSPSFLAGMIKTNTLQDDSEYLQYGQQQS